MPNIKKVVSLSLSSSDRNVSFDHVFLGQRIHVERIGTDGDVEALLERIDEWDGLADAIGMGGMDTEVWFGETRYIIKAAKKIALRAKKTPVVDGTRVKRWVEPLIISYLQKNRIADFRKSKVMVVCGADRSGIARALGTICPNVVYGDLMFSIPLGIPLRSYLMLCLVGWSLMWMVRRLPLHVIYPLKKQSEIVPKYVKYYRWADYIVGDFHFIKKHLPSVESGALIGKTVITNTVTAADKKLLRERGVKWLITPMEEFDGRFPATNVMEGILIALIGKPLSEVTRKDVLDVLNRLNWTPTITDLQA